MSNGTVQEMPDDIIDKVRVMLDVMNTPNGKSEHGSLNSRGRRQLRRIINMLDELESSIEKISSTY